ncbi:N-acetylglucosamine-6-phosphate deacetylase protein [Marine Group I thaumarchaeote SCGC RSA3]|uniref:Ammonium transporter n=4 Tax=Marine Group I TaxID=905826 RepID=A0A081RMR0_9ARCH|nr:N-acetylglucosamine-6-phosphate deacetylase protein [Marine Group I thaumarchaeote SCGC AAA799-N04]KFM16632.1 N-acetylglucosamine-6-phosphate deacetylase protein [Marine Group I thaumarchaeote SCGC AAA799-D11]KFM18685.1 N-acetylglucosamine-6-phosphate deacetylase protein [Marine Group I thaumarchaeote SCGC RSA3]
MVLDSGDTAWMLVAGSLVLLMIPALGLFESGLLRKKNAASIFMQIFFGLALLSVMWFVFGFSLSFSPSEHGLIGDMQWVFLKGVPSDDALPFAPTIPGVLFVKFQLMFACITPLLLTGTIAERMKFSSFIIFISAWSMLIYYPLVHWVWGGGWLAQLGVVDFAGGIVIHTSVGMAALSAAIVLGKRRNYGPAIMIPHSIPLAVLGSSLLWLGWFGFNAGSALAASGGVAGNTVIVTHMASSVSALIWAGLSWVRTGKPSVVATINGAIAGLAGITPASGFVSAEHAFVIGIAIGVISYSGVVLFKEKLRIDDALDVSSVHGVAGIVGSLAIGIFASTMVNPGGVDGLLFGNPDQLWIQAVGVAVAAALGFGGTWILMQIIKHLIGIRVSAEVEDVGLDISEHAESAYSDEEEFMLDMDTYTDELQEKDEIFRKKK